MKKPQVQAYLKELAEELHSAKVANAQEVLEYLTSIMRGEQRADTAACRRRHAGYHVD